ncbi:Asp23/Gls24 family envelope stress response protein [Virgisporangium aurantiacum]|uniref:Asp23/Gls24 family envelope stress response protein n=1 Tax=Virgisporangium aurantiacum TaxID=175570 RepID=A0A8J3YZ16_9ACTN|nr:Asp23/Gls24 family envelope stress response protein [Virgisporangium aurantiacum]GIJ53152.1 hypothetical protein Vau01_006680 [Virgisporangium aurantiacum]
MTDVAYNSPQYGYGTGVPPQPVPPQPMPLPSEQPEQPVASYDVDPSPGHAPPAVVSSSYEESSESPASEPTGAVSFDKAEAAADEPDEASDDPVATNSTSGRVAVQVVDRLRSTAERGTTTVPTPVIEKIATLAVREVPGVFDFAAGEGADGERTLAIGVDGKTATVTLHLVIEYGFAVHSVTEKVRTKVISALENLFSLDVTAVDIVIDDIHLEEPAE